jgi:hypothetical protein
LFKNRKQQAAYAQQLYLITIRYKQMNQIELISDSRRAQKRESKANASNAFQTFNSHFDLKVVVFYDVFLVSISEFNIAFYFFSKIYTYKHSLRWSIFQIIRSVHVIFVSNICEAHKQRANWCIINIERKIFAIKV